MQRRLIGTAAALGMVAGTLLGLAGWIVWLLLAFVVVLALVIIGAEIARPYMRARRQVAAESARID